MLKPQSLIRPSAMLAALALAAAPSLAQEKYHGRQSPSGQPSSDQGRERAQPRAEAPRGQTEGQRPQAGAAPSVESRQETARPRQPQQPPAEQPRAEHRGTETGENDNRRTEGRSENDRRDGIGWAVPRREGVVPRGTYAPHYEPGYAEPGYAEPGYSRRYEPRYDRRGYAPHSHYRPYVFRPRYSFGYGFFAGYPVPYSYTYSSPIWVYGYRAPHERVMIMPGSPYYGGVALEMTPYDADVFVDGTYAGRVEDFDGSEQPLTLSAGMHEIEVQAQGYEPMRVNVEVQPGQIIPYRGDLRPY